MSNHIISKDKTLIEALSQINDLAPEPLVLFVVDEEQRMVGTITDGDSRRALIAGASVNDKAEKIMHRNFNYMKVEEIDDVIEIKRQRELKMKLIPVLDNDRHIVEIINLEEHKTKLPIDAVLMAGGKGERLRPLTEKTPKPLIKVGEKCIIDYNVDRLIDEVMTKENLVTTHVQTDLMAASEILQENKIEKLPVVDLRTSISISRNMMP